MIKMRLPGEIAYGDISICPHSNFLLVNTKQGDLNGSRITISSISNLKKIKFQKDSFLTRELLNNYSEQLLFDTVSFGPYFGKNLTIAGVVYDSVDHSSKIEFMLFDKKNRHIRYLGCVLDSGPNSFNFKSSLLFENHCFYVSTSSNHLMKISLEVNDYDVDEEKQSLQLHSKVSTNPLIAKAGVMAVQSIRFEQGTNNRRLSYLGVQDKNNLIWKKDQNSRYFKNFPLSLKTTFFVDILYSEVNKCYVLYSIGTVYFFFLKGSYCTKLAIEKEKREFYPDFYRNLRLTWDKRHIMIRTVPTKVGLVLLLQEKSEKFGTTFLNQDFSASGVRPDIKKEEYPFLTLYNEADSYDLKMGKIIDFCGCAEEGLKADTQVCILTQPGWLCIKGYDLDTFKQVLKPKDSIYFSMDLNKKEEALTLSVGPRSQYYCVHTTKGLEYASRIIIFEIDQKVMNFKILTYLDLSNESLHRFKAMSFHPYLGGRFLITAISYPEGLDKIHEEEAEAEEGARNHRGSVLMSVQVEPRRFSKILTFNFCLVKRMVNEIEYLRQELPGGGKFAKLYEFGDILLSVDDRGHVLTVDYHDEGFD